MDAERFRDRFQEAVRAHQAGRLDEADALCRALVLEAPDRAQVWHLLGVVVLARGIPEGALEPMSRARKLAPGDPTIAADLASAMFHAGHYADALDECARDLERWPEAGRLWFVLGAAASVSGDRARAEAAYRRAASIEPRNADVQANLGYLLQLRGDGDAAIAHYRSALEIDPQHMVALSNLAGALIIRGDYRGSARVSERLVAIKPSFAPALANLGLARTEIGAFDSGVALLREAYRLSGNPAHRLGAELAIPPMFATNEAIDEFRAGFERRLDVLLDSKVRLADPLRQTPKTAFYLAYQGRDDRVLQEKIARFYEKACPELRYRAPHLECAGPADRPARVGFVSTLLRNHTIGRLFAEVIGLLSRERFDPHVFTSLIPDDPIQHRLREHGVALHALPPDLADARKWVADHRLDVVFFTDVGMSPLTYLLAFSRLAPVQVTSWGHPVTTGIPTVDAFISHDDCEDGDTTGQYTERLLRLPASVAYTCYARPAQLRRKERSDFGLPTGRTLYVCPHSLFKLHPDFYPALREILEGDPAGQLVFVGANPSWTAFVGRMLEPHSSGGRVTFIGAVDHAEFLELLRLGDVLLDTFHFGGGNTTAEAIAAGIPVVTLPGKYMRGRFTYSWLRRLDFHEGVAQSRSDYVRRALQVGTDVALRAEMRAHMLRGECRVFGDVGAVRAFEQALLTAIGQR